MTRITAPGRTAATRAHLCLLRPHWTRGSPDPPTLLSPQTLTSYRAGVRPQPQVMAGLTDQRAPRTREAPRGPASAERGRRPPSPHAHLPGRRAPPLSRGPHPSDPPHLLHHRKSAHAARGTETGSVSRGGAQASLAPPGFVSALPLGAGAGRCPHPSTQCQGNETRLCTECSGKVVSGVINPSGEFSPFPIF